MYSFKGCQNNKNHAFPSKRCISNKNHAFPSWNLRPFPIFINTLLRAIAISFAVCGATEKLAWNFSFFFITSRMEDSFLQYNLAISAYDFFFYCNHIQNFHFLTNGKDITASLRLRSTASITTLRLWSHYYGKWGLSEHKHYDNAATNSNSDSHFRSMDQNYYSLFWWLCSTNSKRYDVEWPTNTTVRSPLKNPTAASI